MNTPTTAETAERTRQILEDLEGVRENLLALSDDIWLSIDHNDPQALDAGPLPAPYWFPTRRQAATLTQSPDKCAAETSPCSRSTTKKTVNCSSLAQGHMVSTRFSA